MADSSISPLPANLAFNFTALCAAVNACINAIATEIVTANNSAAGATTIGNGFVIGIFGATTLIGSTIRGGNTSVANTINLGSNLAANASMTINVGFSSMNATTVQANLFIGSFASPFLVGNSAIFDGFTQTVGTGATLIDSFTFITYRTAEYLLSVSDNNANNKMMTKIHVIHDGGSAYSTEFGTIQSNSAMGVWTANSNTSAVTLYFTPTSTSTNVRMTKISQPV